MSVATIDNIGGGVDSDLFPDSFSVSARAANSSSSGIRDATFNGTSPVFGVYKKVTISKSHASYSGSATVSYYKDGSLVRTDTTPANQGSTTFSMPDCDYVVIGNALSHAGSETATVTITFYKS